MTATLRPRLSPGLVQLAPLWVAAVLLFAACGDAKQTSTKDQAPTSLPPAEQAFSIEKLRAREYLGDVQESVLDATTATLNLVSKALKVFDVSVDFASGTTSGTLTSQQGTLYTEDQPDLGVSKNDIVLEGDVRLWQYAMSVRAPSVHYYAPKTPGDSTGNDVAFRSGGGAFESDMLTPAGGMMHSTGTYFEANRALSLIRGFGPGALRSGSGATTATAISAPQELTAPAAPRPAPAVGPAKPSQAPTAAASKTPTKKPGKKPAQSK